MIDEDYVGKVKHVVSSSALGTAAEQVPVKVMEKIRWLAHFNNAS